VEQASCYVLIGDDLSIEAIDATRPALGATFQETATIGMFCPRLTGAIACSRI